MVKCYSLIDVRSSRCIWHYWPSYIDVATAILLSTVLSIIGSINISNNNKNWHLIYLKGLYLDLLCTNSTLSQFHRFNLSYHSYTDHTLCQQRIVSVKWLKAWRSVLLKIKYGWQTACSSWLITRLSYLYLPTMLSSCFQRVKYKY